jgi:hypothetical protein
MDKAVERLNARVAESEAQVRVELSNGIKLAMEAGALVNSTTSKVEQLNYTTEVVSAQVAKLKTTIEEVIHKVDTSQV